MSNSATFELKTDVDEQIVVERIAELWSGFGYNANVYSYPQYGSEIFCNLEYVFGLPKEEKMLREVVDYLLGIAFSHQIYYYRCADFAPLRDGYIPILEIQVDDLFSEEFRPSIGASIEAKYLISEAKDSD
ncbi:MAG: hypothetical protein SFY66_04040 [Oculatellaceae cyanobacterium bins.114]|nr:hypothetical protein [Oculatellaceae cyanobacterium bins.114]